MENNDSVYASVVSVPNMPNNPYEIKCPGKEITGLIFGISSLVMGATGLMISFMPYMGFGLIFGTSYGISALILAIVAFVLHGKVMSQATVYTKKIKVGRGLAIAGLITGIISFILGILFAVIYTKLAIDGELGYSQNTMFYYQFARAFRRF